MKLNVKLTANELMNVVDAAMDEAIEQELYFDNFGNENVKEILTIIDAALAAMGIEIIPDEEPDDEPEVEEEEEEFEFEEEEEDGETEMESLIYDVDGQRGIAQYNALLLVQCVTKTMKEKFSGLPDDILQVFIESETLRIAKAYGIEVVDMGA